MRDLTNRFGPILRRFAQSQPFRDVPDTGQGHLVADTDPLPVPPMRPRVEIPTRAPSPDHAACARLRGRGQQLARQDEWDVLSAEISDADAQRRLTPGLQPEALLLAEGARSDAVGAARNAILHGNPRHANVAIAALESIRDAAPDCGALAAIVASAHVDAANAWRGSSRPRELAPQRRDGFDWNMRAATALIDQFDPFEMDSALWATLRCAVLDGDPAPAQRVCDDYEDLLELAPQSPDNMRLMGRDLLPSRYGTFEILEKQARRAAMQLRDIWGMGAYSWVWMGAMETDPSTLRRVDIGLFREGMRDIADRFPDQHMINRLCAFTGITLPSGNTASNPIFALAEDFDWLASERLTELHPEVWALAPVPGNTEDKPLDAASLAERGKARAMSTLAERFADRLGHSSRLVFGDQGLQTS